VEGGHLQRFRTRPQRRSNREITRRLHKPFPLSPDVLLQEDRAHITQAALGVI
jgi:hypothetical protein